MLLPIKKSLPTAKKKKMILITFGKPLNSHLQLKQIFSIKYKVGARPKITKKCLKMPLKIYLFYLLKKATNDKQNTNLITLPPFDF